MTKYVCPNFGNCDSATAREAFQREAGQDLKCPHCQTALELHPEERAGRGAGEGPGGNKRVGLVIAAVVGIAVAAGAVATVLYKPKASAPVVAAGSAEVQRPAAS